LSAEEKKCSAKNIPDHCNPLKSKKIRIATVEFQLEGDEILVAEKSLAVDKEAEGTVP